MIYEFKLQSGGIKVDRLDPDYITIIAHDAPGECDSPINLTNDQAREMAIAVLLSVDDEIEVLKTAAEMEAESIFHSLQEYLPSIGFADYDFIRREFKNGSIRISYVSSLSGWFIADKYRITYPVDLFQRERISLLVSKLSAL